MCLVSIWPQNEGRSEEFVMWIAVKQDRRAKENQVKRRSGWF